MGLVESTSSLEYWENKFIAYMHDPFDKAISIKDHEKRSAKYIELFGLQRPNIEFWKKADAIAAGFERGVLPGYEKDSDKSGAIDFLENNAILTHPIADDSKQNNKATIGFDISDINQNKVFDKIYEFLRKEINNLGAMQRGKIEFVENLKRYLFYVHFFLRHRLAYKNVGGLGSIWYRIPADTRIPDHSIWEHNALTSALSSILNMSNDNHENIGLMVLSITPVQGFINKARKLRDFWVGSLILSWLAFEGILWIIENLGFDHIIYPSLFDQTLMLDYLKTVWDLSIDSLDVKNIVKNDDIASFPNKFMFLIPLSFADEIGASIENKIYERWKNFVNDGFGNLFEGLKWLDSEKKDNIYSLFRRQTESYWDIQWAATKLIYLNDESSVVKLIEESNWGYYKGLYEIFQKMYKYEYTSSSIGTFYPISNTLVQSALTATKSKRIIKRTSEQGEKCHLCGEFEVVNPVGKDKNISAGEYKEQVKEFWEDFIKNGNYDKEIKQNERLCSICLLKRLAPRILKDNSLYLANSFKFFDSFPTTTYISLNNYFSRNKKYFKKELDFEKFKKDISNQLFDFEDEGFSFNYSKYFNTQENLDLSIKDYDKYYAILMMDGDKMGKLINGSTISAKWEDVIHPLLVNKIKNKNLKQEYVENWNKIFSEFPKRSITPAIHSAISNALGSFSTHIVPYIISNYDGRLIYAGGDDVLAVVPVEYVLRAAREIKEIYNSYFKIIEINDEEKFKIIDINGINNVALNGRLTNFIGSGAELSISAGVLICHYKENLSQMINRCHRLLEDYAKEKGKRNSCAIELKKRNGESRYFVRKWNDKSLSAFEDLVNYLRKGKTRELARSFAYKLEYYQDGFSAIANLNEEISYKKLLVKDFITSLLKKSPYVKDDEDINNLSKNITNLVFVKNENGNFEVETQGLIIASFLSNYIYGEN